MTFGLGYEMENENATDYIQDQTEPACGMSNHHPVRNFDLFNGTGREEKQHTKNRRRVQSKKNVHLYEDDFMDDRESRSSTSPFELDEHGIRSSVKALGINYSNLRLEQMWERGEKICSPSGTSVSTMPKVQNKSQSQPLSRDKFARNVLMRSLMKQQQELRIGECSSDTRVEPTQVNDVGSMQKQSESDKIPCNQGFIQDSIQPDLYYRSTTVTNENIDFTIEHVGKKTIVPARKFIIENYNEMDFVFSKKK